MRIVDAHCHFGKGDALNDPAFCRASLKEYLKRADKFGIAQTAVWPILHRDYVAANRQVAALVRRSPSRFIGVMFVHAEKDKHRLDEMAKEFIDREKFRAIKLHRHDASINRPVCELAARRGLPVVYDLMGALSEIEIFAAEYPKVNFIIPHLGTFGDRWQTHMSFIQYLERFPNVYTDTSSVRRFDILVDAVRRGGAHKVIFGSDGPWLHPGVELTKILELPISNTEKTQIAGGNFLSLIRGIRPRAIF